jgi:hypothetical protein
MSWDIVDLNSFLIFLSLEKDLSPEQLVTIKLIVEWHIRIKFIFNAPT